VPFAAEASPWCQGWFLKKSTWAETALFAVGGLFLVFPAIRGVILRPCWASMQGPSCRGCPISASGFGYNVFLGLVFAAAAAMQRVRTA
jgi:hypothetical protein